MQQSITVGVHDWTEFSPSKGFYPPDLPEDWRLSYFANEFDSACISLAPLSSNLELLSGWCEDLPDSFELSFSLNHIDQLQVLTDLQQQVPVSIRYLVVDSSNSDLLTQIKSMQSGSFSAAINRGVKIFSLKDVWRPDTNNTQGSSLALRPTAASLRQYRHWIEAWLQSVSPDNQHEHLTLWLPGSGTDYRLLSDCRTLVEMMGY